jgi:integrase
MAGLSQRDRSVLGRFEGFCALEGLPSPATALRDPACVEAFLAIGCTGLVPHSLGTYRSVLRRLGDGSVAGVRSFPGSPAPRPYSRGEVTALWSMAAHQSSARRLTRAKVLLASMLGAGLHPGELARLEGTDVHCGGTTTLVVVTGARARRVRVRAPYDAVLGALAKDQAGYLFRPGARVRGAKNLIGEVCAALVHDPDEVSLVSGRARSTFICAHLVARTPLAQLCAAAGVEGVESLLRYARHVDGAPASKAQLRAAARRP